VRYQFEWDFHKARSNQAKHGVRFDQAATVFRDPYALSLYDDEHSDEEDRWITLGIVESGGLLVVHHTYDQLDQQTVRIRVISARKANRPEQMQYTKQQP